MSQTKDLYEKVAEDPRLQETLMDIINHAETAGKDATVERLTVFAAELPNTRALSRNCWRIWRSSGKKRSSWSYRKRSLDLVAGGKTMNANDGLNCALSISTLGTGCLLMSVVSWIVRKPCSDAFEESSDVFQQ